MIKTFQYRVKNHLSLLRKQARAVNYVWNYCNQTQKEAVGKKRRWLTGFDLGYLTAGAWDELGLPAHTGQTVCSQYAKSRTQHRKPWLKWRSGRKNLGWIPFRANSIKQIGETFRFNGAIYKVRYSRPIPEDAQFKDGGSFSQDSLGRWYLNLVVELPQTPRIVTGEKVGIDLGLKEFATLSSGEVIKSPRNYRKLESKMGTADRAGHQYRLKKLHRKARNQRKDFHHKLSTKLVKKYDVIAVGNVNASALAKTNLAKSVLDAGWSSFREMLRYKAIGHGVHFEEVSEKFTTQLCSFCNNKTGPKGVAGLGIRTWCCSSCGANHDRDVNSAINILSRIGYDTLAEGAQVRAIPSNESPDVHSYCSSCPNDLRQTKP
jgi:putative transposase